MEEIVLVLTTLPENFDAQSLARDLVEGRLAACVSVLPLQTSTYHWQGALETAREHQVVIKTTAGRVDDLREALRNRHPYEVPEFLVIQASGGDAAYLQWVRTSLFES
jgi:periplasmic divalent cation tolerance protein